MPAHASAVAGELQALQALHDTRRDIDSQGSHPRPPRLALIPRHAIPATTTATSSTTPGAVPRPLLSIAPDPAALAQFRQQAEQLSELIDMRTALWATRETQLGPTAQIAPKGDKGKAKLKSKGDQRVAQLQEPRPDAPNLALLSSRLDNTLALYQRLSVERARALGQLENAERRLSSHSQALESARQKKLQLMRSRQEEGQAEACTSAGTHAASAFERPGTPRTPVLSTSPTAQVSQVSHAPSPEWKAIRVQLESLAASESLATQALNTHRKEVRRMEGSLQHIRRQLEIHSQLGDLPDIASAIGSSQVIDVLRRESLPDRSILGARVHEADYELFLQHFAEPVPVQERAASPTAPTAGGWRIKPQFLDPSQADRPPLTAIISALSQVVTPHMPPSKSLLTNFSLLPPRVSPDALHTDPLGVIARQPDVTQRQILLQAFLVQRLDDLLSREGRLRPAETEGLRTTSHRRVRLSRHVRLNQTQMRLATERWSFLCGLIERHRDLFLQDLTRTLGPLIETKIERIQRLRTSMDSLDAQLSQLHLRMPHLVEEALAHRRQVNALRDEFRNLAREHHQGHQSTQEAAAQDTSGPPERSPSPSGPASLPTRSDALFRLETQIAQIQGRMDTQAPLVERARESYDSARRALTSAEESVSIAEAQLVQGVALHTQHSGSMRRARRLQQQDIDQTRQELAALDARIRRAQGELMHADALNDMITPEALARALERHVEPDHQALRERATHVGRATAYASEAHLVMALVDIHQHLHRQARRDPGLAAILHARTHSEFQQAVARHDDHATDMILEHPQPLGHGFSDAPDQTARPTPARHSSYSLSWRALPGDTGRVQVSHLHPYLPPRPLRALEGSTSFQ